MKYLLALGLLVASFATHAINIQSNLSGSWYNPDQSGHGLAVEVLEGDRTLVYWYVYKKDGSPMFLITVGNNNGDTTTGDTYYYSGMKFGEFDPNDNTREVWGSSSVTFSSCDTAILKYTSNNPEYGSGQVQMQRLTSIARNACTDTPVHGNYGLTLVDQSGIGFGVANAFENGDLAYLALTENYFGVGLGSWTLSGEDHFEFSATLYSVYGGWESVQGIGKYEGGVIDASYTGSGRFFASPAASFQHSLRVADMSGNFDMTSMGDPNQTIIGTVAISSTGLVEASTIDGCNFSGYLSVPNTKFNQAYINGEITNCTDSGDLVGALIFSQKKGGMIVLASNGYTGFAWQLKKR